jgi:hypothetical protein
MGTLPFFLEYAQCPNKAQKNLRHPEAQVRGGSGQQQVDRVADLPFEEVADSGFSWPFPPSAGPDFPGELRHPVASPPARRSSSNA